MKKLIQELFFLRKGERRALLFIAFLLSCSIGYKVWVDFNPPPEEELNPAFVLKMRELQEEMLVEANESNKPLRHQPSSKAEEKELQPFPFDPNTISKDSLIMMHISDYVATNIVRYRAAGGKFYSAQELSKIYGLDREVFELLLPFIRIRKSDKGSKEAVHIKKDSVTLIELNGSDTLQLMDIPGIGPSFSRRILKYRSILGGYHHSNQLWDVYGMDSIRMKALQQYTVIDTSKIILLPLNSATFKELVSRPFINKSETYAILQYREYVDSIRSVSELETNQIIEHDRFIKMLPYLCLD